MKSDTHGQQVERMFPFVLRSGVLVIGRDALRRRKGKLHFVLITTDISANSRDEILKDFAHYPVVQHYLATDLERLFKVRGAKVIGFAKAGLSQSIYAELKSHRINQPMTRQKRPAPPPVPPIARKARSTPPSPRRDPQ